MQLAQLLFSALVQLTTLLFPKHLSVHVVWAAFHARGNAYASLTRLAAFTSRTASEAMSHGALASCDTNATAEQCPSHLSPFSAKGGGGDDNKQLHGGTPSPLSAAASVFLHLSHFVAYTPGQKFGE